MSPANVTFPCCRQTEAFIEQFEHCLVNVGLNDGWGEVGEASDGGAVAEGNDGDEDDMGFLEGGEDGFPVDLVSWSRIADASCNIRLVRE